jgi:hypothetical protein
MGLKKGLGIPFVGLHGLSEPFWTPRRPQGRLGRPNAAWNLPGSLAGILAIRFTSDTAAVRPVAGHRPRQHLSFDPSENSVHLPWS